MTLQPAFKSVCDWVAARLCGGSADSDAGYAAVDAMVALTILSTTLALAICATSAAARDGAAAAEMRHASDVMSYVIEAYGAQPGQSSGQADGFDWALTVDPPSTSTLDLGLQLCSRSVAVTAVASGRHYALKSARLCAPKVGDE